MADPRAGRAGQSGSSPRLGRRDPRNRTNAAGAVSEAGLDRKTLGTDGAGRTRFTAFDSIPPLAEGATLAEVTKRLNLMLARAKGQT